jgi:hypothetical protein
LYAFSESFDRATRHSEGSSTYSSEFPQTPLAGLAQQLPYLGILLNELELIGECL